MPGEWEALGRGIQQGLAGIGEGLQARAEREAKEEQLRQEAELRTKLQQMQDDAAMARLTQTHTWEQQGKTEDLARKSAALDRAQQLSATATPDSWHNPQFVEAYSRSLGEVDPALYGQVFLGLMSNVEDHPLKEAQRRAALAQSAEAGAHARLYGSQANMADYTLSRQQTDDARADAARGLYQQQYGEPPELAKLVQGRGEGLSALGAGQLAAAEGERAPEFAQMKLDTSRAAVGLKDAQADKAGAQTDAIRQLTPARLAKLQADTERVLTLTPEERNKYQAETTKLAADALNGFVDAEKTLQMLPGDLRQQSLKNAILGTQSSMDAEKARIYDSLSDSEKMNLVLRANMPGGKRGGLEDPELTRAKIQGLIAKARQGDVNALKQMDLIDSQVLLNNARAMRLLNPTAAGGKGGKPETTKWEKGLDPTQTLKLYEDHYAELSKQKGKKEEAARALEELNQMRRDLGLPVYGLKKKHMFGADEYGLENPGAEPLGSTGAQGVDPHSPAGFGYKPSL